jgi:MoxR-like ATPase
MHESSGTARVPYYLPSGTEIDLFETAADAALPLMVVGPTGCGKTRFVEYMAGRLGRSLRVVVGNDDTTTADLLGRYLVHGADVKWHDGPVTTAVRHGELCYVDEVVEIRREAIAALHPLADHRRSLHLDRTGETVVAPSGFALVCSYNPARVFGFKELRPAFSQRFVTIPLTYLPPDRETEVIVSECGVDDPVAARLVGLATSLRNGLRGENCDPPSTRLLVSAAHLIRRGLEERIAVEACILAPLASGRDGQTAALREIAAAV